MSLSSKSVDTVPSTPNFEMARSRFPGTASQAYLDVASRSLIPESAMTIAAAHLRERMDGRVDKARYFGLIESARARFARLIGAHPSEIAITKNVSEGLNIIAGATQWHHGDTVLVCSDIEHPNNIYPWRNLERHGVSIIDVPAENGLFPLATVLERLHHPRPPRVVTVSGTSFRPGFRTDLDTLGAACANVGTMLVVDGAQSAGVMHLDVSKTQISALAVSTQKGLCALYGMGFLYVRHAVADIAIPQALARFGVDIAATHEADYDSGPIRYRLGALRFDVGNYNFLAAALVDDTLALLESYGTQAIDAHVTHLATTLSRDLQNVGAPVLSPVGALPSNIVCLSFASKPEQAKELQVALKAEYVQAAVRGSVLRFSMHLYNNLPDIKKAADVTAVWLEKHSKN